MIATSGQYIFTVSEVNQFIKDLLDNVPPLQEVLLRGEISNYKLYPSGHHYFTLKDSQCSLKCVMFRGSAARLRFRPENGMKVIAFGRIGVFPRSGYKFGRWYNMSWAEKLLCDAPAHPDPVIPFPQLDKTFVADILRRAAE